MEVEASLNNLRIGPRKVRLVADLVRGLDAVDAISQLKYLKKKPALHIIKLIESAISNAENNHKLQKEKLFIKYITVDEDVTYKRWMPRAFGRAGAIRKRGSKVNVVLAERNEKVDDEKES
ncbi:50S ribosomal protein L22 [Candidatus Falkowbacteria bacterium RBG_13_39_14]|uniref:Large ribosomal subunit protein uL22 n=1 Tax=Candidatus Falkowbacteria bacterium RBG_13_39_14 TaxID=1797985 RepID=A0A1F5S3P2_9BACT|nr:MAG: 50S ribosomal protein L22 [Candidatus Falkowbacteria bacterium RBG_13_39_14]